MTEPKQDENKQEHNKELEYTTCVDFVKYSGGVQLALFSFFSALMSGFAYFIFGKDKPTDENMLNILKWAAFAFSFGLWFGEESHAYLTSNFFCRARDIECELGFDSFSRLPKITPYWHGPMNWAFRIIYFLVTLFWFIAALEIVGNCPPTKALH